MKAYSKDLKALSQKLRSTQTEAERKLWQRISRDQLLGFRFNRQKPLLNYIVDFYCSKAKLVIELDGGQHYEPEHQEKDRLRDAELNSLGFTVMRFDNYSVMTNIDSVVEAIYQVVPVYGGGIGGRENALTSLIVFFSPPSAFGSSLRKRRERESLS